MFNPGEAVVCIDAADIPSQWAPLFCGKEYIIRSVEIVPPFRGNFSGNVHKNAQYCIRLWGVNNLQNPLIGKEYAYADTRFEKIQPNIDALDIPEVMNQNISEKAAA